MSKNTAAQGSKQQHTNQQHYDTWCEMRAAMPMAHGTQQQACQRQAQASGTQHATTTTAPKQSQTINTKHSHFTRRQDHHRLTVNFCSSVFVIAC